MGFVLLRFYLESLTARVSPMRQSESVQFSSSLVRGVGKQGPHRAGLCLGCRVFVLLFEKDRLTIRNIVDLRIWLGKPTEVGEAWLLLGSEKRAFVALVY